MRIHELLRNKGFDVITVRPTTAVAEALSLLRNDLELKVLNAVRDMKVLQISEADEQIAILKKSRAVTEERENYYASIQKIIPNEQLNLDKLSEAQRVG